MIKVALIGVGRTGSEIAKVIMEQEDMQLVMAVCSNHSNKAGKDLGEILHSKDTGIVIMPANELSKNLLKYKPDVAIDFSSPEATIRNAEILTKYNVKMVIGTTGFTEIQTKKLMMLSNKYHKAGFVLAPNITLGVNVLMLLSNLAASILESYDFEIVESHFKGKRDMPSGTAKKIAKELVKGMSTYKDIDIHEFDSHDIPIHSIRAGGIIGRHRVIMAGEHDKIEIIHESFSRKAFALGALRAVRFIHRKHGFFEMNDVLDLRHVLTRYLERETNLKKQKYFDTERIEDQMPV